MSWTKFFLGFLMIALFSFAEAQISNYWVSIEFSFFLIFFIIRDSSVVRALVLTFILSFGLDLILQATQIKGLASIGQLFLVYLAMVLKEHVIPVYEDLFLLTFFAFFYLANYYIQLGLSHLLGTYFQTAPLSVLVFQVLFHMVIFTLLLNISNRGSKQKRGS